MGKSSETENLDDLKAFLGEDTEFKGVLNFSGTVRIDGRFEGEIISEDTLIVGESSIISADISVGVLIAKGQINGNISASKKTDIRTDSKVVGNVKTSVLVIEEGAIFDGHCEMVTKENKNKSKKEPKTYEEEFPVDPVEESEAMAL